MSDQTPLSRRRFLRLALLGTGATALAACGPAPAPAPTSSGGAAAPPTAAPAAPTVAPTAAAAPTAAPTAAPAAFDPRIYPGSPNSPKGWTTKLPAAPEGLPARPPITITASNLVNAKAEYLNGDGPDDNPFTRLAREELGIEWKEAWRAVTTEERQQKLQLAIASGDLPDVLDIIAPSELQLLLEADLVEDITDAWERYADPERLKAPLEANGRIGWSYAEINGRKMGLPMMERVAQNDMLLWVRQDWLDKVGLKAPTTLDELEAVATAFVEQKLGGENTIGLTASKELNTWVCSIDPIFAAFGVLPSAFGGEITATWQEVDGKLAYGSVQPAMREALATLARWYEKGLLRPDFYTVGPGDAVAEVSGNQSGMFFAPSWIAGWGVADSIKNDPNARWTFVEVPAGPDGTVGKRWSNPYRELTYVVRKGFPHVKELIQYWNWVTTLDDPTSRMHGWENFHYTLADGVYAPTEINQPWTRLTPVFNGLDPMLDFKRATLTKEWASLPEAERDAYQNYALNDESGLNTLASDAYLTVVASTDKLGIRNLFTALPTATMTNAGPTLQKLEQTTFQSIITGEQPIESFDSFVEQWNSLGGEQITAEVNEWYASKA